MTNEELMYALQSLSNMVRLWREEKSKVDREYAVDDRPRTEAWTDDIHRIFKWGVENENLLAHYRTIVALRLGRRPSSWTADEMITLLGEKYGSQRGT